jgi:1-acyl-sn-glycerol-3-phosphate acyltransferase
MAATPPISALILGLFRTIVRRYFRRHFHAVRLAGSTEFAQHRGPLIIYANHSSWWDPMVAIFLAKALMPHRRHYAPMEKSALERYPILRRVGIFPVEINTPRGALQFIRTSTAILTDGGVLWITPQGRFVDARSRPLHFQPGMATLAARISSSLPECRLLPLAIEYPFWDERNPEVLLRFGEPLELLADEDAATLNARMVAALETTMEQLQHAAIVRDPRAFRTLSKGTAGVGGFYGIGQRLKALLTGRPYQAEHTALANADQAPSEHIISSKHIARSEPE